MIVAMFFAWPLVHITLVRKHLVEPWKLGAWGMYTTLQNQSDVQVFVYDKNGEIIANQDILPPKQRLMFNQFKRRRDLIGALASPHTLGQSLLYLLPGAARVEIRVGVVRLDPSSKYLKLYPQVYEYQR